MQTATDYKALYEQQLKITEELQLKVAGLTHQFSQLQKMIFGSKHERFVASDPNNILNNGSTQLSLGLDVETIGEATITDAKKITYLRRKTEVKKNVPVHPGRHALPAFLRREVIVLEPDTDTSGLKKIGEEITEILDFIPAEYYVKQYIRPNHNQYTGGTPYCSCVHCNTAIFLLITA